MSFGVQLSQNASVGAFTNISTNERILLIKKQDLDMETILHLDSESWRRLIDYIDLIQECGLLYMNEQNGNAAKVIKLNDIWGVEVGFSRDVYFGIGKICKMHNGLCLCQIPSDTYICLNQCEWLELVLYLLSNSDLHPFLEECLCTNLKGKIMT